MPKDEAYVLCLPDAGNDEIICGLPTNRLRVTRLLEKVVVYMT